MLVQWSGDELQSEWHFVLGKAAGHADRRQSEEVADAAHRISETESLFQILFQLRGSHRKRGAGEQVVSGEHLLHLGFQNSAQALGTQEISGRDLLVYVAADFSRWIRELRDLAGLDQ